MQFSLLVRQHIICDCFGHNYARVFMRSDGFCGFHALSYALTGTQDNHEWVIRDCINMFRNSDDLFRFRTSFGSRENSTLSVDPHYDGFMRDAMDKVSRSLGIHEDAWMEDGHLAAIAVLYNIAIFTYKQDAGRWYGFNESGCNGYICLLSVPGHWDVLLGINDDGRPTIPALVHTQGISRDTMNLSDDALSVLRQAYNFSRVSTWPPEFGGV